MSNWSAEGELEHAQQKAGEFSQKAKKAINEGDLAQAEQLLWWADRWQVKLKTWQTIVSSKALRSPKIKPIQLADIEKVRKDIENIRKDIEKVRKDIENIRKNNAKFADKMRDFNDKMRDFNERMAQWTKISHSSD
ncbi:MAG: hypothetical protein H7Y37_05440 [Anaerolineae bacterium]|nr:hypothetical protein [Gloeobacterales cyanobacterium ES-bin-313]